MVRKKLVVVIFILSLNFALWSAFDLAPVEASPSTNVFSEDFEGTFPGTAWAVGDSDSNSGYDYWDDNSYKSHSGSWSGWCADIGTQPPGTATTIWSENMEPGSWWNNWYMGDWDATNGEDYWGDNAYNSHGGTYSAWCARVGHQSDTATTIFTEDFEGTFPGSWTVGDWDSDSGEDYWDDNSGYSAHGGSWVGWCADIGYQSDSPYEANTVNLYHDDDMEAYMYKAVSLGSYTDITLTYWWATDTEGSYDYLQVMYYDSSDSSWHYTDKHYGDQWTWQQSTVDIPNTATYIGFYFYSDFMVHNGYHGAVIDDIVLEGYPSNYSVHEYDGYMEAYMYRAASLSSYTGVTLSYYYWIESEGGWDYLKVMYYDTSDSSWHYTNLHSGDSGGWQYSSVSIPSTATYVGFYFEVVDNVANNYEGAYVDDVTLTGIPIISNLSVHQYDNDMNAYMYRAVSLSSYDSVTLSYYYWIKSESGYDYLKVCYYSGGSWHYIDPHSGDSGGWQYSSVSIPSTATHVGFYFDSDDIFHAYEGAYIDDIVCTGYIFDFSISASPSSRTIEPGQSTTYTVSVPLVEVPTQAVALSVSDLPSGASGSFNPASGSPSFTSTLTVTTSTSTPPGTYTLTISGTGGGKTHTTTVTLNVATAPVGSIIINDDDTYTTSTSVTLTLYAESPAFMVEEMRFSNDDVSWSTWEPYATSKTWMLSAGVGTKTVYVQFKNEAGVESISYSDSIELVEAPPFEELFFNITVDEVDYVVATYSNSSVSEVTFNMTQKRLRFTIDGYEGTTGLCNISVPAELMWGEFSLYLDDIALVEGVDYSESSNGTHFLFSVNYMHSSHMLDLFSTEVVPDFASWLFLPFLISATLLGFALRKRLKKQ